MGLSEESLPRREKGQRKMLSDREIRIYNKGRRFEIRSDSLLSKRIGLVGCGHWGMNLARNLYELDALCAICDTDREKLKCLQNCYPDIDFGENLSALLENPQVDALAIATPAATHFEIAKQGILAGKDIFVEKPLALKYEEGEELVFLAKEKERILMVGHILEYHPAIVKLKEIINHGDLGRIHYIYSNRLNLGKFRTEENILWSFAPHDISVMLHLLGEMPEEVAAYGGNFLNPDVTDVTVTTLNFRSGVKAHIFVSWLHPYKEQKLVVIGDQKMIMFDDVNSEDKLFSFNHKIDWIESLPVPRPQKTQMIEVEKEEPLRSECQHFIECVSSRKNPRTDGVNGLRVLKILELCQKSLKENGKTLRLDQKDERAFFVHSSSFVDKNVEIGEGTKIWHFSHILRDCKIGKNCVIGQNACVGPNVQIGDNVRIQNNVSIYEKVTLEDDVFCGPSMVFTNVVNPRSHWPRKDEFKETLVRRGATLGANSTILCGITIGQYAFIGAGAFVNRDVPDYALVYGIPARIQGWMCFCGTKMDLSKSSSEEKTTCQKCGRAYKKKGLKVHRIAGDVQSELP